MEDNSYAWHISYYQTVKKMQSLKTKVPEKELDG
jgi:hypothetical protein